MESYEATIKSRDVNGAYGLGFTLNKQLFSQLGHSLSSTPSGIPLNWPRMDEMACCEVRLKFRNVNGACGLGFAQIKHHFSRLFPQSPSFSRCRHC